MVRTIPYLIQYQNDTSYKSLPESQNPRTILFWNSLFYKKSWGLPKNTVGPGWLRDEIKCPVHRCVLTINHEFLHNVEAYDAIVFHTAEIFPIVNSVPTKRNVRQLYVFATIESPYLTHHNLSDEGGFYNLTMTYRLNSDVLWPYLYLTNWESGEMFAPAKHIKWRTPLSEWNDTEVWSSWANRTKTAAWFVSNYDTPSKREKLVEALQKFIDVDIYGKCEPLR